MDSGAAAAAPAGALTPELFALARRIGAIGIRVVTQGADGPYVAMAHDRHDKHLARSWDTHPTPAGAVADLEKRMRAAAGEPE